MTSKRVWILALLAIVLVAPATNLLAGPRGGVTIGSELFPSSELKDDDAGSALQDTEVQYEKSFAVIDFPFLAFNDRKTVFANTLYAEYLSLDFKNVPGGNPDLNRLVGVDYALSWIQNWSQDLRTTVFVKPGAYYDGVNSAGNIYRVQGGLLVSRVISKGFEIGVGAGYENDFGQPQALPLVAIKYHSNAGDGRPEVGSHIVDVNIPKRASYFYAFNSVLQLGGIASVSGGKYRMTRNDAFDGNSVKFSVGTVGPAVRLTPTDNLRFELTGGTTFRRAFEVRNSDDDELADFELKNAAFGRLTATYNF